MHYVYVMVYISLAVAMQLLTGNFPVSFFAFPLNLIFAALWLFLLWMLYKEYKIAKFTQFFPSKYPIYRITHLRLPDNRSFPSTIRCGSKNA